MLISIKSFSPKIIGCVKIKESLLGHNTKPEKRNIRGLLEKYPTFGREKETGLLGALDT